MTLQEAIIKFTEVLAILHIPYNVLDSNSFYVAKDENMVFNTRITINESPARERFVVTITDRYHTWNSHKFVMCKYNNNLRFVRQL